MEVEPIYNISLKLKEAYALKKMLGYVTDVTKSEIGLDGDDIESMRILWSSLPYDE